MNYLLMTILRTNKDISFKHDNFFLFYLFLFTSIKFILKIMKNGFYFMLKALFVIEIFTFLS